MWLAAGEACIMKRRRPGTRAAMHSRVMSIAHTLPTRPHRTARHGPHRAAPLLLAVWLAVCLVGTQIAGLGHRIEHPAGDGRLHQGSAHHHAYGIVDDHAQDGEVCDHSADAARDARASGLPDATSEPRAHAHDDRDEHEAHHCAAYDAATLGDGPPLLPATTTWLAAADSRVDVELAAQSGAATRLAFQSRAPPRA